MSFIFCSKGQGDIGLDEILRILVRVFYLLGIKAALEIIWLSKSYIVPNFTTLLIQFIKSTNLSARFHFRHHYYLILFKCQTTGLP